MKKQRMVKLILVTEIVFMSCLIVIGFGYSPGINTMGYRSDLKLANEAFVGRSDMDITTGPPIQVGPQVYVPIINKKDPTNPVIVAYGISIPTPGQKALSAKESTVDVEGTPTPLVLIPTERASLEELKQLAASDQQTTGQAKSFPTAQDVESTTLATLLQAFTQEDQGILKDNLPAVLENLSNNLQQTTGYRVNFTSANPSFTSTVRGYAIADYSELRVDNAAYYVLTNPATNRNFVVAFILNPQDEEIRTALIAGTIARTGKATPFAIVSNPDVLKNPAFVVKIGNLETPAIIRKVWAQALGITPQQLQTPTTPGENPADIMMPSASIEGLSIANFIRAFFPNNEQANKLAQARKILAGSGFVRIYNETTKFNTFMKEASSGQSARLNRAGLELRRALINPIIERGQAHTNAINLSEALASAHQTGEPLSEELQDLATLVVTINSMFNKIAKGEVTVTATDDTNTLGRFLYELNLSLPQEVRNPQGLERLRLSLLHRLFSEYSIGSINYEQALGGTLAEKALNNEEAAKQLQAMGVEPGAKPFEEKVGAQTGYTTRMGNAKINGEEVKGASALEAFTHGALIRSLLTQFGATPTHARIDMLTKAIVKEAQTVNSKSASAEASQVKAQLPEIPVVSSPKTTAIDLLLPAAETPAQPAQLFASVLENIPQLKANAQDANVGVYIEQIEKAREELIVIGQEAVKGPEAMGRISNAITALESASEAINRATVIEAALRPQLAHAVSAFVQDIRQASGLSIPEAIREQVIENVRVPAANQVLVLDNESGFSATLAGYGTNELLNLSERLGNMPVVLASQLTQQGIAGKHVVVLTDRDVSLVTAAHPALLKTNTPNLLSETRFLNAQGQLTDVTGWSRAAKLYSMYTQLGNDNVAPALEAMLRALTNGVFQLSVAQLRTQLVWVVGVMPAPVSTDVSGAAEDRQMLKQIIEPNV